MNHEPRSEKASISVAIRLGRPDSTLTPRSKYCNENNYKLIKLSFAIKSKIQK